MDYQAKLRTPFGVLGIRCGGDVLRGIDFLPMGEPERLPATAFAERVCDQLRRYFDDPNFRFDLSLDLHGTPHQLKVWQAMCRIPPGEVRTYGALATELHSAAQAVGQACGANPIPVVIPCHRIVGKSALGGFMRHADGGPIDIKRWLLAHEGAL